MERTLSGRPIRRPIHTLAGILCAAAAFLALAFPAGAADVTFQLRNGDKISGTILSESGGQISLRHPIFGVIQLPSNEVISRFDASTPIPAVPSPAPAPQAAKASPPSAKAPTLASAPVKAPPPRRWSFDVQAGIDLGFGATDRQLYNARGRAFYSKDKLRNSIDGLLTYGKTEGIKSADRIDGSMKTDYDIAGRLFLYNLGGVGYDSIRSINLRYEIGPGVGYHVLKKDKIRLNVELGANYQAQFNADATESESFFYRIAEDWVWQVTPKLAIEQRFEFFPGIGDFEKYRARFEGTARYSLRSNLYLNVTVLDLYDNRPAHGISNNDLQLRSAVGVKF